MGRLTANGTMRWIALAAVVGLAVTAFLFWPRPILLNCQFEYGAAVYELIPWRGRVRAASFPEHTGRLTVSAGAYMIEWERAFGGSLFIDRFSGNAVSKSGLASPGTPPRLGTCRPVEGPVF